MKADITIEVKATITKDEDGGYTAVAHIFGAYGMGDTKSQAIKSLEMSLDIIIDECISQGVLVDKLSEQDYSKRVVLPKNTPEKSFKKLDYHIPLNNIHNGERLYA